jgi:hypothetical protein
MHKKKVKRITYLKLQMTVAIFLLTVAFISGFFIFGPDFSQIANALTGNYNRTTAQNELTRDDWNLLDEDFVAKSGDTMTGPLNMGNQRITNLAAPTANNDAVNLSTLDSRFGSGGGKKIICGETPAGTTDWRQWGTSEVTIYVDINVVGFTSEPIYLAALSGAGNHFMTLGTQSVYNTTATGFRIYITKTTTPSTALTNLMVDTLTPTMANSWGWHIHWCGVGN